MSRRCARAAASRAGRACRSRAAPPRRSISPSSVSQPHAAAVGLESLHRPARACTATPRRFRLLQQPRVEPAPRQAPGQERQVPQPPTALARRSRAPARSAPPPSRQQPDAASSASSCPAASTLQNSPQTLSCGPRSRSSSTTRSAGLARWQAAAAPGEPAAGDGHVPAHARPTARKRHRLGASVRGRRPWRSRGRAGPRPRQHAAPARTSPSPTTCCHSRAAPRANGRAPHRPARSASCDRVQDRCARPDGRPTARPRRIGAPPSRARAAPGKPRAIVPGTAPSSHIRKPLPPICQVICSRLPGCTVLPKPSISQARRLGADQARGAAVGEDQERQHALEIAGLLQVQGAQLQVDHQHPRRPAASGRCGGPASAPGSAAWQPMKPIDRALDARPQPECSTSCRSSPGA